MFIWLACAYKSAWTAFETDVYRPRLLRLQPWERSPLSSPPATTPATRGHRARLPWTARDSFRTTGLFLPCSLSSSCPQARRSWPAPCTPSAQHCTPRPPYVWLSASSIAGRCTRSSSRAEPRCARRQDICGVTGCAGGCWANPCTQAANPCTAWIIPPHLLQQPFTTALLLSCCAALPCRVLGGCRAPFTTDGWPCWLVWPCTSRLTC